MRARGAARRCAAYAHGLSQAGHMQQEQQVSDGASANGPSADRGAVRPSAEAAAGAGGVGSPGGAPLRVVAESGHVGPLAETVPSDQLWRAAIRAAREAAALAAELRRQLAGGVGPDGGPRAVA